MEGKSVNGRYTDGSKEPVVDGFEHGRGSNRRCIPEAHSAAVGRLPLRSTGDHPASDAIVPAPLPAAARHLPLAGDGGREGIEEKVQAISDRLLSYRYRGSPH